MGGAELSEYTSPCTANGASLFSQFEKDTSPRLFNSGTANEVRATYRESLKDVFGLAWKDDNLDGYSPGHCAKKGVSMKWKLRGNHAESTS